VPLFDARCDAAFGDSVKGALLRGAFLVGDALDRLGLGRVVAAARRHHLWKGTGLTVAVYHRVADPSRIDDLDPELVDATPEDFDAQMAYLRQNFHPIGIDDVLRAHRERRSLPPDSVLVTFDDGYRDNYQIALPILQRHRIPAAFFVTTGYLTDRRLFWWERVNLLVRASTARDLRIDYPAPEVLNLSTPLAKARAKQRLNRIVKDHYGLDVERFMDGVAKASGVRWSEDDCRRHGDRALMTWDDVRALRAAGMGVGSHTVGHRVLQTLAPTDLATELRASRAQLEEQLGEPVTTIAYPVGKAIARFPAVRQALADAGYELGFTSRPGSNRRPPDDDPFDLRRISIDRDRPASWTRLRFAIPSLR
jgi:peptidoglycan/xylan/chitin deacetylase (PgdA/CDA1 family)